MENKVETLEKASQAANHENGLLRAQVARLQVELREYRKRLSWLTSGSGFSALNAVHGAHARSLSGLNNNDFYFDFPKFGDLPGAHIFNNGSLAKSSQTQQKENPSAPVSTSNFRVPGVLSRDALGAANGQPTARYGPSTNGTAAGDSSGSGNTDANGGSLGTAQTNNQPPTTSTAGYSGAVNPVAVTQTSSGQQSHVPGSSTASNSDSPGSSSESQHGLPLSSSGTSPEPGRNSPSADKSSDQKGNTPSSSSGGKCGTIGDEKTFCEKLGMACGSIENPVPAILNQSNRVSQAPGQYQQPSADQPLGFNWFVQQNGGQFDPVLFNDYREPQDAVLSQDFGAFFNDAFPLPDLGSPFHNLNDTTSPPAPKKDLIAEIDSRLDNDDEEVVPGEDTSKMLTCTKIWCVLSSQLLSRLSTLLLTVRRDRLQSMEKFRNGEIDVDSLCTELRTKARCSEGGVVVNEKDVEDIMGRVK